MKIKSYQVGGNIQYLPTVDAIPGAQQSAPGNSASGGVSQQQKMSELTKSVVDQIRSANGIDSDVTTFINTVQRTLMMGADPTGEQLNPNDVFRVQIYANKVKENAKYRDLAVRQLNQQDAWGEIAIDNRGKLYVSDDKGKLSLMSPTEYYKADKSKYIALTYKDLMYRREQNKGMAFNTNVLMDMQNAVGMSSITDAISKIIRTFGNTNESKYMTKGDKEVANGLASLIGNGPDGVYKITVKESFGATDQQDRVKAINFIINALPKEYRNSLMATAAAEGLNPMQLISDMIQISANVDVNPQYQKMASDDKRSGSKTLTLAESYATGEGAGTTEYFEITPEGASVKMLVAGRSMSNVKQKDGKQPIGKVSLQYMMENAYGISDQNLDGSISFGDQPLTESQKNAIMYDGLTMRRVELPYKLVNGKVVPDFEIADQIEKLTVSLRDQYDAMTPGQLQDILNERLPGARWDPVRNCVVWPRTKAFLTFRGIASSEFMDINKDSKYLAKVSDDRGKELQAEYEEVMKYGSLRHEANAQEYVGRATARGLFNRHADKNKFYEGNVFIALDAPTVASAVYNGQEIPKGAYTDITERAEIRRDRLQMRTNF